MNKPSLIEINHQRVSSYLKSGDYAIDATIGNGNDILKLSKLIAPTGHVIGIDIQPQAITNTQDLLIQHKLINHTTLINGNHQNLRSLIPINWHGKTKAILFNLGYLPKGDKRIITSYKSTLPALESALKILSPTGILSIMLYPGHAGGDEETCAVKKWAHSLDSKFEIELIKGSENPKAPELLLITLNIN